MARDNIIYLYKVNKPKFSIYSQADPIESRTTSSTGKEHFPTKQQDKALETSNKMKLLAYCLDRL